jgi:hypothetical protein
MSERAQALEAALRVIRAEAWRSRDAGRQGLAEAMMHIMQAADTALSPAEGVSPQPDTRRDCTCLGTCKGADGLSPRYRCALGSPVPISPMEPTPEPLIHNDRCSWCLTQADHIAASEECYERNSERGRSAPKSTVAEEPK